MINTRKIIVDLLTKTLHGHFVDDCINKDERIAGLSQRDKNFIRASLLTTLRHLGEIDHFLTSYTKDKENILRVGVAQIKFMGMPKYAVIDEMVGLVEAKKYRAFLNTVLRKSAKKMLVRNPQLNYPKWMRGSWKKAYGAEKAQSMMEIMITEPDYIDLSYKGGKSERILKPPRVEKIDGYAEGEWWVQDKSQRFAVEIMGDIAGKKILDMCAAPGGKTAQLIDSGAIVTALDASEKRIEVLRENLARLKMECEVICADARDFSAEKYDIILLDAPCTATGTIRRHPEMLYQKNVEDVQKMNAIQSELLGSAYNLLKDNGILVYSTCSLQYEEGEGLMKKQTKWELLEEKRILPCDVEDGIAGAYIAKLKKL